MNIDLFAGILVLLALAFLTPYFYYIPKASLAAVICMAVYAMVEYQIIKPIWKTKSTYTFGPISLVSVDIGSYIDPPFARTSINQSGYFVK